MRVSCRRRSPRCTSRVVDVERQVAELNRVVARTGAAQQRTHPRAQLLDGERLDEVVVRAGVETLDPVVDRVTRGDDEDRDGVGAVAQRPADVEPADLGHQQVEHDRVGRGRRVLRERVGAVDRFADLVVHTERAGDRRANGRVVVDHEDASRHGRIVSVIPKSG